MKKNNKKYQGKYIATKSFIDTTVVASGKDPIKVYDRAVKKGIKNPVIDYVFQEGSSIFFKYIIK